MTELEQLRAHVSRISDPRMRSAVATGCVGAEAMHCGCVDFAVIVLGLALENRNRNPSRAELEAWAQRVAGFLVELGRTLPEHLRDMGRELHALMLEAVKAMPA